MRFRGVVLAGLVAAAAAACGDDGMTSSGPGLPDSAYWVATTLPADFRPVYLQEDDGDHRIAYMSTEDGNDVFDAPLSVSTSAQGGPPPPEDLLPGYEWGEEVRVHGHDGYAVELQGDGVVYGMSLTWEQEPGLWITVGAADPITRAELDAVAEGVQPVDEEEWARLRRALSMDTHVGTVDPDAVGVEATSGEVDGDRWTLTALVPGGYPLGPEDRRRSCYRLSFRGATSDDLCDTRPWRLRVGGQVFAFGTADAETEVVRVNPSAGDDFPAIDVPTAAIDSGPPARFWATPLPDDACFLEAAPVGGGSSYGLGPTGPLHRDPDRASCMASIGQADGPGGIPAPPSSGVPRTTAAA